jgi:hypothetical protein
LKDPTSRRPGFKRRHAHSEGNDIKRRPPEGWLVDVVVTVIGVTVLGLWFLYG